MMKNGLWLAAVLLQAQAAAAAAPPPLAPFSLQEPAALAASGAYAADVCKRVPASCAEARALESGYKSLLASATACDRGECTLPMIRALASSLAELDRRDAALPLPAEGRLERAFLSLSVIATSRLTSAATRLGNPEAAKTYGGTDRMRSQRSLAAYCLASPPNCGEMRALIGEEEALAEKIRACAAAKCLLEAADPLADRAHGAFGRFFTLDHMAASDTLGIFSLVNGVNAAGIALYSPLADGAVAELSAGADKLKRNLDLAEKNAAVPMSAIEADGPALLESHRRAALASDRLSFFLGYKDSANGAEKRRSTVNAAAIKLSGLRARAFALRTARGLGEDKAGPGAAAGPAAPAGARPAAPPPGVVMTEPGRTFLDRRLVPAPAGPKAEAPAILPGKPGRVALVLRAGSKDPAVRADALRRLNRTKTLGDPARYAPQAFTQEGNDSCAVAAQVAVLRAHGLLPATGDPKVQERALVAEAKGRGYMTGGTPPEYTASLLIERGMLVDKHPRAKWPELEAALRRGGLIQASVDAGKLWKLAAPKPLAHSILVTGTEVSNNGREILGVYINDTGTDPAGAGKFVPIGEFRAAWFGNFAEVR